MDNIERHLPKQMETSLVFFVNGKKVIENKPDPEWTLLWYLRRKLQLTGTKYGCGEGGCGACTVMLSQYVKSETRVNHIAVNACLTPLCSIHGFAVTTVEGIGLAQDRLHPVQERIAKSHGSQCGFCTPGIVMSMYALLRNKNKIHYDDIEEALQGNLCRCTGYRPIIEGFQTFTEEWKVSAERSCKMGKDCCRLKNNNEKDSNTEVLFNKSSFQPYNPTQEPIFPPELKLVEEYSKQFLFFKGNEIVWIRPQNLEQMLSLKEEYPYSKIIVGNTEVGVEVKCKKKLYPILLSPQLIFEMNDINVTDKCISVGASVTLTRLQCFLQNMILKEQNGKCKIFATITQMLYWFAGSQIRNAASIVGNIITASPISDLNPILMASSSSLIVCSSKGGMRKVVIDETFFTSYRKVSLAEDEVVISLEIPFTEGMQFFNAYKQSRRRDDDISIVTGAFNVKLDKKSRSITEAKLCFGGMGPTTILARKTSDKIVGCVWNETLINKTFTSLNNELQLDISVPGGMADYRKSLCLSLFFRFYNYVWNEIHNNGIRIKSDDLCASQSLPRLIPKSTQCFEITGLNKTAIDGLGKPITHVSAEKQATGEAVYCDDIPIVEDELFLSLVLSTESHAKIISIDPSRALMAQDVVAFFSASDLTEERNKMGVIYQDEEIFSRDSVTSRSCVIGAIVAKTENAAKKARDLVKVTYEKLKPLITIEEAIRFESYYDGYPLKLIKGDVKKAFAESSNIKDGHVRSGAQEHFYLETISAFATREEEELKIICTTQNPADIARIASETLGISSHKIVSKVKRIGGGFGGKETKASVLAIPVAIAAYKLKKPVRSVLDRDEDMQITGYRHPCLIKYKVAFNDDGKILGAVYDIYANAGNCMDISCSMIQRALFHVDNCYFIPNIQVNAYLCKTNTPSNTAFRGFGAPQAMMAAESMIRGIASSLNRKYEEIASLNLYREGSLTHFNQILTYCTLSRCWNECLDTSKYWQRKEAVIEYNRSHRWKKKGLCIVPTKYGISFQGDLLMQGGVLLLVYKDGSVLLSIGGIEMGQGLFTKMIQVASRALEVEVSKIHISEMATDKVPNSSPTAASISSDLYGMAIINACNTIKERLEPIKKQNPNGKWEEWISKAYFERICLSATGFYAAPKVQYNREKNSGSLYEYFTYGVACSEVIIDCLTGDHQVLRTDIVMDVGESLNPAIDIGQIEGAFTQGYGYYTIEEMLFSPNGEVLSKGPGAYKIPGFSDIPKEFNVSLLKGAPNPRAVYSSKAIGEPPLFLASSVFFAIKEAIKSAREDAGVSPEFTLDVPATCARIRMACEDSITQQVKPSIKSEGKSWNITL